jgi:hypothetical protein
MSFGFPPPSQDLVRGAHQPLARNDVAGVFGASGFADRAGSQANRLSKPAPNLRQGAQADQVGGRLVAVDRSPPSAQTQRLSIVPLRFR